MSRLLDADFVRHLIETQGPSAIVLCVPSDDPEFVIEVAADLARMFADFGGRDEETSASTITIRASSPDGDEAVIEDHPANFRGAMARAWQGAMVHAPPASNPIPIECCVYFPDWYETGDNAIPGHLMWVKESGAVRFAMKPDFSDAIQVGEWALRDPDDPPLDNGALLLQAITVRELAGIEPILAELWKALDSDLLSEVQQHQLRSMAELIKEQVQEAEPGKTERWKIIGPIRSALRYLATGVPRDALAWWKLIDLLQKIDWPNVAHHLQL